MLFILLISLLIYMNARLAASKGMNTLLWSFISLMAFFVAYAVLGAAYFMLSYKGDFTPAAVQTHMKTWITQPLNVIMMFMLGAGGTLLIRYVIERQPPRG